MTGLAIPVPSAPAGTPAPGPDTPLQPVLGNLYPVEDCEFSVDLTAIVDIGWAPEIVSAPAGLPVAMPELAEDTVGEETDALAAELPVSLPWLSLAPSSEVSPAGPGSDAPVPDEAGVVLSLAVASAEKTAVSLPAMANRVLSRMAQDEAPEPASPVLAVPQEAAVEAEVGLALPGLRSAVAQATPRAQGMEPAKNLHAGSEPAAFPALVSNALAKSAERPVSLPGNEAGRWQEPLRQALGERLQVLSSAKAEQAVIRLDPPQMGRIEIAIRHEAGGLTVNLSATHNEVLKQLQGIGEHLRQDLVQRHQGEVAVTVTEARSGSGEPGANPQSRGGQRQPSQQEPGRALDEAELRAESQAFRMGDGEERAA